MDEAAILLAVPGDRSAHQGGDQQQDDVPDGAGLADTRPVAGGGAEFGVVDLQSAQHEQAVGGVHRAQGVVQLAAEPGAGGGRPASRAGLVAEPWRSSSSAAVVVSSATWVASSRRTGAGAAVGTGAPSVAEAGGVRAHGMARPGRNAGGNAEASGPARLGQPDTEERNNDSKVRQALPSELSTFLSSPVG